MTRVRDQVDGATRGLPRVFWYIWIVTLINRLGAFVLVFLSLYLSVVRDFTPATIGFLLAGQGAGAVIGTHVSGKLADTWGRRHTLLLSIAGTLTSYVLILMVDRTIFIGVVMVIMGAATNMARPAYSSIIADVIPPSLRPKAYNLNHWAINLGHSGASLLGGFAMGYDFRLIFIVNAATLVIAGALVWRFIPETKPTHASMGNGQHQSAFQRMSRDRIFWVFVALTFLPVFMMTTLESMLPLQVVHTGLSGDDYGFIIAVNGVAVAVGQLFIPLLIRDKRRTRVLAVACILWSIGFAATGFVDTVPLFMITVLVWTMGEMLQTPVNASTVADMAPADMRGRYQAAYAMAWQVAAMTAPLIGGLGLQVFGSVWWPVGSILGILAAAGNLLAGPSRERHLSRHRN